MAMRDALIIREMKPDIEFCVVKIIIRKFVNGECISDNAAEI